MPITANDVAAIAILGGFAGVVLTSWNQRALVRAQYVRDHRTEAYLQLIEGVHIRQLRLRKEFSGPADKSGHASEAERMLTPSLLAFCSERVYRLYGTLDTRASELGLQIRIRRGDYGVPSGTVDDGDLRRADADLQRAYQDLVNQVRMELEFRPWRTRVLRWLRAGFGFRAGQLPDQPPSTLSG
jgi:hypothetical protein